MFYSLFSLNEKITPNFYTKLFSKRDKRELTDKNVLMCIVIKNLKVVN